MSGFQRGQSALVLYTLLLMKSQYIRDSEETETPDGVPGAQTESQGTLRSEV